MNEPTQPPVRAMLVAKIDELVAMTVKDLEEVKKACDQLEPDRARSCGNAAAMASIMLDEIRLRAHAAPLSGDEDA